MSLPITCCGRHLNLDDARLIEVETVMGMLERGNATAASDQARQHLGDERRLAGSAPAGEADDAHGLL